MTREIDQFLTKLQRSLAPGGNGGSMVGSDSSTYKIAALRESLLGKSVAGCVVLSREKGERLSDAVYQAKDERTQEVVTLRMLKMQLGCQLGNVKRFEKGAAALSSLRHDNLVNVRKIGRAFTGQPFMITERCDGKSLATLIAQDGAVPWKRAAALFVQACDALQYAHEKRVVHGQLKPQSILVVTQSGVDHVKVTDFSLGFGAKARQTATSASGEFSACGVHVGLDPAYLSPEQCSGGVAESRSDIYSLGTVMYECLTGRRPFDGLTDSEIMLRQLADDPRPFSVVKPDHDVPAWFEAVVLKAMQKERIKRFRSMNDIKSALENGLKGKSVLISSGHTPAGSIPAVELIEDEEGSFLGQVIAGVYKIESFIGGGGMSMVYKAVQRGTDRMVAVKFLRRELCTSESSIKRFDREAKSLGRVPHPNLIAIFDVGIAPTGQPYMVTEFLEGQSLKEILNSEGPITVQRALRIFIQVCDVMEFSHQQGIIHRDIKPANIMLVKQGGHNDVVKVVDFGIVKLDENIVSVSQKLTASGEICGSPMYMSPEQIQDDPLDGRTDIYSLGTVIFEVISGRPLFGGKKITEVMNKHVRVTPPPLSSVVECANYPLTLDDAVALCLQKRPEQRIQTMGELKEVLMAIQAEMGDAASSSSGTLNVVSNSQQVLAMRTPSASFSVSRVPAAGAAKANEEKQARLKLILLLIAAIVTTAVVSVCLTLLILNATVR